MSTEETQPDILGAFLRYADRLDSIMDGVRPRFAYAERCICGATVEIGVDVPARERGQLTRHFIARHQHCTQPGRDADLAREQQADNGERTGVSP